LDRRTEIDNALADVMQSIDGSTKDGYTFYNTVQTVNIEDEAVTANTTGFPAISIMEGDNGGEEILEGEQRAYRNEIFYELQCEVQNDITDINATTSPKNALKVKMNELLSDIKKAISDNTHLNNTCDICSVIASKREYTDDGNIIRAGDLIVEISVIYSQSRINPDNNCAI
jgi:hypothetical protein